MNSSAAFLIGQTRRQTRRAFSLLEVLFAVIVLGLGLLGIAAVFPSIIQQQQRANQIIEAGTNSATIEGQIGPSDGLLRGLIEQIEVRPTGVGPEGFGTGTNTFPEYFTDRSNRLPFSFLWEIDWSWNRDIDTADIQETGLPQDLARYIDDGGLRFSRRDPIERRVLQPNVFNNVQGPDIPITARLIPPPIPAADGNVPQPEYVWDLAARRTPTGDIQVAVFIRTISNGISVPAGLSLAEVLTGSRVDGQQLDNPDAWRTPLGFDYQQRTVIPAGAAMNNSDGNQIGYSVPMGLAARVLTQNERYRVGPQNMSLVNDENIGRYIEISATAEGGPTTLGPTSNISNRPPNEPDDFDYFAVVGQRFVDNLGVVRRVSEVFRENNGELLSVAVDPPYLASAASQERRSPGTAGNQPLNATLSKFASELRQVVFTPQIPVSITVRTLSRSLSAN